MNFNRRHFLIGLGATIPLPYLHSLDKKGTQAPVRLIYLFTKSGMWTDAFTPKSTGKNWEITPILKPLEKFRSEVSVLSKLRHLNAYKPNPIVNRHGQDQVCHLTAADLGRIPGIAAKNSISIDQMIARQIGENTRIPTLNLSVDGSSIAFNGNGDKVPSENRPDIIFNRMFGDKTAQSVANMEKRFRREKSVLDNVLAQTKKLNQKLGKDDREKIEAYLTSIREVERRLQIEKKWAAKGPVKVPAGVKKPGGIPKKRTDHIKMMMDLITLALQTDQTRIVTLKLGDMGCMYPEIGASDGYHGYTHGAGGNEDQRNKMIKVDTHRVGYMAYLMEKLKSVKEGNKNILYNSFIHYGAGMGQTHGEGAKHIKGFDILPNIIAGNAGGRIKQGQHIDFGFKPLTNLFVTMGQAAGARMESFVDSTGPISEIMV